MDDKTPRRPTQTLNLALLSAIISTVLAIMATLIKYTAFEPLVTGPLLWVLTRGSPDLRARVLRPLASLPFHVDVPIFVTTLKWLFALGLLGRINSWLNKLALNNWKINTGGKAWDMPNEVAAITGGSGGIGSEVIKRIARTGMKIAIMDLQPPGGELKSLPNVHFYECNITDPDSVTSVGQRIKADLGAPTILFNNAGIGGTYNIIDVPNDYLNKIFQINLLSHWYTTKVFLPDMIAMKKGHIIGTASMASFINAAGMVDYCVTKAGVMSFHEGLTQELKHRYNAPFIKSSLIHPYWVRTNLVRGWVEKSLDSRRNINNPLTPLMTPEYVADAIAKAILSGESQQVILPPHMGIVASTRAMAMWLQEVIRDSTRTITLTKG